jgi:hypothetical protein
VVSPVPICEAVRELSDPATNREPAPKEPTDSGRVARTSVGTGKRLATRGPELNEARCDQFDRAG